MTYAEIIDRLRLIVDVVGPNLYLQAGLIAVVFIILGKIADWILSRMLGRIAEKSDNPFDDECVRLIHRPIFLSFVFVGLAIATDHMELGGTPTFVTIAILKTFAIVIWYNTIRHLADLMVRILSRANDLKVVRTGMLSLVHNTAKVVMVALAGYFLFLAWAIDVTAWIASAGILGLALSFAAKDTLSNLFAGISIIMDSPYKNGDFIILESGERGEVTNIGLRSTRILTRDDIEITVPNGLIGNGKIINEAGGPPAQHRIRSAIGVAYGSDVDEVIKVLEDVAKSNSEILKEPEPRVRFRAFGESSLDFELLGWINNPAFGGRIKHDLNCAIYKALNTHSIEIPFPQRDLHVKSIPEQAAQK